MYSIEIEWIPAADSLEEQRKSIKECLQSFVNYVKIAPKDKIYFICAESSKILYKECIISLFELVGNEHFDLLWTGRDGNIYGRRVIFYNADKVLKYEQQENMIMCYDIQGAYCLGISEKIYKGFYDKLICRLLRNPDYMFIKQDTILS